MAGEEETKRLEKLLKDQKTYATHIERFVRNTEKLGANNLTLDTLTNRLQVLEGYWTNFIDKHTELARFEDTLSEEEYFINDSFSETEIRYTLAKTFVTSRLTQLYARAHDGAIAPNPLAPAPPVQITTTASSLPKLTLPKFSGQQADWDSFKDIFTSMVKDQPALTPTLKLQHLLACVEGEAARALKNLQVTGANFEVAWESLARRYENKRLRISTYMKRLLPASKKSVSEYTRLLDTVNECRRGLNSLGEPVNQWDRWFICILVFSLDTAAREQWELHLASEEIEPSYDTLVTFLEGKIQALDTAHCSEADTAPRKAKGSALTKGAKSVSAHLASDASSPTLPGTPCPLCQGTHRVGSCLTFKHYTVDQRWKAAREHNLCFNCLSAQHKTVSCSSTYRCRVCKHEHHSLLHRQAPPRQDQETAAVSSPAPDESVSNISVSSHTTRIKQSTLLGTAYITISNSRGHDTRIRALVDPASEGSFITQRVVQTLGLKKTPVQLFVCGVEGQVSATSTAQVTLIIKPPPDSSRVVEAVAAVLPTLSALLPKYTLVKERWPHLNGLQLADSAFGVPAPVDCVLGADVYPDIVREGLRRGPSGTPMAQNTIFGWLLIGPSKPTKAAVPEGSCNSFCTSIYADTALSQQLRLFWELEECQRKPARSPEDEECDAYFRESHSRDASGRYTVRLPFREAPCLPGTRTIAQQRLLSLEKRLAKDAPLKEAYSDFLNEYLEMRHMKLADEGAVPEGAYLPHYAVRSPSTNKLRVVFNASQGARNAKSLNDFLHSGPKLQQDISTILLRWRTGKIAFTADIVKMFRQIKVTQEDCKWQRILWRERLVDQVQAYDLTTVTYGTACAPYLALRVLQQLAKDEHPRFPLGAMVLRRNMYVDDALISTDTLEEAKEVKSQLIGILRAAGMQLSKWSANTTDLDIEVQDGNAHDIIFDSGLQVPTLGLRWSPASDSFSFRSVLALRDGPTTKRSILSTVARIYDPIGWISPVTVRAKILIQQLWLAGHDWDAPADPALCKIWENYCDELPRLNEVALPRWIGTLKSTPICLHGFSDASERAYAAVVYIITQPESPGRSVSLVAARCKVAPVKTISVPRLELRGAVLLAQLMEKTLADLELPSIPIHCWTDSEVVLAWLRAHPCTWKTFVSNRVAEIHELIPTAQWAHVRSKQNPADLGSRGCTPEELLNSPLWWTGPAWLKAGAPSQFEAPALFATELEKRSTTTCLVATQEEFPIEEMLQRFSAIRRACRVLAYCLRWRSVTAGSVRSKCLAPDEERQARVTLFRAVQAQHFNSEMAMLKRDGSLPKSAPLIRYRPFLDQQSLMRIGGRLEHTGLGFNETHPVIIPKASRLADLLILEAHQTTLDGGPTLVQSYLLRSVWIVHARSRIRKVLRSCVICARFQGKKQHQLMAAYPAARVTPARPFTETGLDYAGPFWLRTSKGRGQKAFKGYVAVFLCLVTRAVHLKVVSDCSAKTFLLAFRRFIARRGLCRRVLSDQGTTFQGADTELQALFREASSASQEIAAAVAQDGIAWEFIPPRAPHFGGVWEAAMKAFKTHLKRVVGETRLTFEEFSTLAAQIEACLNSRPHAPLSSDPEDYAALTPGHFLVGAALLSPPEISPDEPADLVPRWRITSQLRDHFWKRWRKEVIQHMQHRAKWQTIQPNLVVGDLVLLTDDQLPPSKWPLARITQVHPGQDGLVRVVSLRTPTASLRRPIAKIIRLPIERQNDLTSTNADAIDEDKPLNEEE